MRRSLILPALAALALLAAGAYTAAGPRADAAQPGPIQIGLLLPRNAACPAGAEIALPSDPASDAPGGLALFIPPSGHFPPNPCARGLFVTVGPGPIQTPGKAFGLPLGAETCADGTAALLGLLDALGGSAPPTDPAGDPAIGPGPIQDDPCPEGSAAVQGIADAIAAAQANPGPQQCPAGTVGTLPSLFGGSPATYVLVGPGPINCPPGTALYVRQDAAGTATGWLAVQVGPGPISLPAVQLYRIAPSGVPGESNVKPPNPN